MNINNIGLALYNATMIENELFIHQLDKLISIPSVSDDREACREIVNEIERTMPVGAVTKRWQVDGVETLVAGNNAGLMSPDIAFIVHADVVKAVNANQYKLRVNGDKLFGRGTSDMKFSIPIGLALLETALTNRPDISFSFVVTTDEEIGGKNGVKYLVKEKGFSPKCVIVPDAGDGFRFINKMKGLASIEVNFVGKAAHSSEIWNGHNANHDLCLLGSRLVEKYQSTNNSETWQTTMNMGIIRGGEVPNQVTPRATMNLDFRFPDNISPELILSEVNDLAKTIGPNITVSLLGNVLPTAINLNNKDTKLFIEEFEKILGKKINVTWGPGVTDARHFTKNEVSILMIKPNGGDIHGENEWISLLGCMLYLKAVSSFIQKY